MIEHLKSDDLVLRAGGRFKLCTLIQRRLGELLEGARPLVERKQVHGKTMTDLEVVIEEIAQNKIAVDLSGVGSGDDSGGEEPLL